MIYAYGTKSRDMKKAKVPGVNKWIGLNWYAITVQKSAIKTVRNKLRSKFKTQMNLPNRDVSSGNCVFSITFSNGGVSQLSISIHFIGS